MLPTIIIAAVAVIGVIAFLCAIYRVADIDKALIITGGKEPIIKVSGGSFVIPIFRKAQYFDLCMLTVKADKDEIKTVTAVPIIADWTAQIRPDTSNMDNLRKAIMSFKERGQEGIINDVKLTLTGAVRDVVASMSPEAVLRDKVEFTQKVRETVRDEMINMGLELVSLNMQDITDRNGYYDDIAALDREEKRREAENKKAEIDKEVRTQKAASEREAAQNELAARLAIAEKQRDNNLRQAEFKAETDTANANAAIAGQLQTTKRMQEVAEQEGRVAVIRQEQANLAAQKEKEVILTRAEAEKQRSMIDADAKANVEKIHADAQVQIAEKNATAVKIEADANAAKVTKEGHATAEVIKAKGTAEAEMKKMNGAAEAEVVKQKGLAEAEAEKARLMAKAEGKRADLLAEAEGEKAKLLAQAEGEQKLAEARASNDKVNFEIEKIKIEQEARIVIATKTAEIMAEIGKNAEFVNIGGAATGKGATGNVLLDTLAGVPALMKTLDAENQALNGQDFNGEIRDLIGALVGPAKGLLVNTGSDNPAIEVAKDAGELPAAEQD